MVAFWLSYYDQSHFTNNTVLTKIRSPCILIRYLVNINECVDMLGNLSSEQIETVLHREVIGRIGCYADDRVFVVPITYVYAEGFIYGHSAEGMKISMMRKNPRVCFEVDSMTDMTHWQSVVVWGIYEEMKTKEAHDQAMNILIDRMKLLKVSETMRPATRLPDPHPVNAGVKAITYRIKIYEKTGKFES